GDPVARRGGAVRAVLLALLLGVWFAWPRAALADERPRAPTLTPETSTHRVQYDPDDGYYDDGDDGDDEQPSIPPGNIYPSPYDDEEPGYDYQREMERSRKRDVERDLGKILGDNHYDYCRDLESRVR